MFTSLIHTCELSAANPFEYLTALQRHADTAAEAPELGMPWNYTANINAAAPALSIT